MKTAFFYLFSEDNRVSFQEIQEQMVCNLASYYWRKGNKILINCQEKQQAERLDELMWQLPTASFIPHNLAGEGNHYGAPVELCWAEKRGQVRRQVVINLQQQAEPYLATFKTIIDFVAAEEVLKNLARERYKIYRKWGFSLKTNEISTESFNNTIID